jgi:aspartyl-tRNA(Asn)/glutamyl-tRNA(Gln) amidotransferase subunit A
MNMPGLRAIAMALRSGETTSTRLVEQALELADQSRAVFTAINPGLLNLAASIDRARQKSPSRSPLAGIPIALKDLFNVRNESTLAGSIVRKH